jgi:hypothetical protein
MIMCTDILWIHKIHDIIKTNISWSNIKNVAYWQIIKKSKSPMMSSCLPQSVRIIDLFSITCTFTVGELSYVTYMMLAFADRCQGPFRGSWKRHSKLQMAKATTMWSITKEQLLCFYYTQCYNILMCNGYPYVRSIMEFISFLSDKEPFHFEENNKSLKHENVIHYRKLLQMWFPVFSFLPVPCCTYGWQWLLPMLSC